MINLVNDIEPIFQLSPSFTYTSVTTKLAHLQENMWATDFSFTKEELTNLTADLNKIKIVGDRYTGISAQQTQK